MKWINVKDKLPKKEHPEDIYTNCTCGILNILVVYDAVYHHADKKFYRNMDTSHFDLPIAATHWMIIGCPKK